MNTFFDKLTGSPHKTDVPDAPDSARKEPPRRAAKRPTPVHEEAKSTHVKVEPEGDSRGESPESSEDDGELTVDIYDKGDNIVIQSTVAGVRPEDLDVSITNDSVAIRGRREQMEEVHEKDYYYKELFWGSFARSVILPEEIDDESAEATLKHGLLTIHLPKKRKGVVQKLKVKVS